MAGHTHVGGRVALVAVRCVDAKKAKARRVEHREQLHGQHRDERAGPHHRVDERQQDLRDYGKTMVKGTAKGVRAKGECEGLRAKGCGRRVAGEGLRAKGEGEGGR